MSKRKTALFLSLCMLFSAFSTVVYADNSTTLTGKSLDAFLEDLNEKASTEEKSNDLAIDFSTSAIE